VGERKPHSDTEELKIAYQNAYEKIFTADHPGLLPPFIISGNQYVLFSCAGSLGKFPLTLPQAKIGFLPIVQTLKYMHQTLNVVHLDVKGPNILLRDNGT
jgi:serine/threonine protein kinase